MTTRWPCSSAWRSAAAITVSAPASSTIRRVRKMAMASGSFEGDGPDRVVGGDQETVAGEGEVDGARELDLAQQGAGGGEDEQAGAARGVDVAAPVGLQAVGDAAGDRREAAPVGEHAPAEDVEGVDHALLAVAHVEHGLVGRERQPVGLPEPVGDELEAAVVAVDVVTQLRRGAEALQV